MLVTRSLTGLVLAAVVACGGLLPPSVAAAHELVDEGRRLYEEAEFVAALDVLGRAAAGTGLDVEDVVRLYETRALVELAMGQLDAMREDLRRLAAIRPDHALPATASPDLVAAFAELRVASSGAPRLTASTDPSALGVTITARVDNDPLELVRVVRIVGRTGDAGPWQDAIGAPLFLATPTSEIVEYYAEAIGPGGAVIARTGGPDMPLRAAPVAATSTGDGSPEVWPWVVGGISIAVVAAVVVIVVVVTTGTSEQPSTDVSPFAVRF